MLDFRVLGPLEVLSADATVALGGSRQRIVLALLVLEVNHTVTVERLVEGVWQDAPPSTARSQVQAAIAELRRRFDRFTATEVIVSDPAGYRLSVPAFNTDVGRFYSEVAAARELLRGGDQPAALDGLRSALNLWRGDPATGLSSALVAASTIRLAEDRLTVTDECLSLELALGRHHEIIGELRRLVATNPMHEGFIAHLMLALHRAGRQTEALNAYQAARRQLIDEYGLDPGARLTALERAILANDPALDLDGRAKGLEVTTHISTLNQLPADIGDFVGRADLVRSLRTQLAPTGVRRQRSGRPVLIVLSGPGGVGKTTLAIHASHIAKDRYPDGQLFARMSTADAAPMPPEEILREFLRALGFGGPSLQGSVHELATMFRSRLAHGRFLIVLDDAMTSEQIRPLLPGSDRCAVLVTSRNRLHGIAGAKGINVGTFDPDTSAKFLATVVGPPRVNAERPAARHLAEACGHLPLALRIAAAKLSARPHWTIDRMTARLSDERRRLDELALDGLAVRANISLSWRGVSPAAQRLLLMLGTLDATDFGEWVTGPLLVSNALDDAETLQELVDAWLVDVDRHGGRHVRYRLHDLVRIFVTELAELELPADERIAAHRRVLGCWLFLVRQAHERTYGGDFTALHADVDTWPLNRALVDTLLSEPFEWFELEQQNLTMAVAAAARMGDAELCWDLAVTQVTFFESGAHLRSWHRTHEVALAAARDAGSARGLAAMHYSVGALALFEDRLGDAERYLTTALASFKDAGDEHGRGLALRNLALIDRVQGRYADAEERYAEAIVNLRHAGDRVAEAHALIGMAQIHLDFGQLDEADHRLAEAVTAVAGLRVPRIDAQARHRLGHLRLEQGRWSDAETEFRTALNLVTGLGDPVGIAYALLGLGRARSAVGDWEQAELLLRQALGTIDNIGDRLCRGRVLSALSEVLGSADRGAQQEALDLLNEAEELFVALGAHMWIRRTQELRRKLQ